MTAHDSIDTWRKVAQGDTPIEGLSLVRLRTDGAATIEEEFHGEWYSESYTWRLTKPDEWERRRIIPLGEVPELDEECVEVLEHTVVAFDGVRMVVAKFDFENPFHYERVAEPGGMLPGGLFEGHLVRQATTSGPPPSGPGRSRPAGAGRRPPRRTARIGPAAST